MKTLQANNGVVRFEPFCGKENSRAKATNMVREMQENVELRLVEPTRCPECDKGKE